MNAPLLLLGLLLLAYFASLLLSERRIRGFGLPSGAEYVLLGVTLGPEVLGIVTSGLLERFTPILVVGAAWLAFVAGVGYTHVGTRRVALPRALLGIALTLLVALGMFGALYGVLGLSSALSQRERLLLAVGGATAGCESTRHTVRWAVERCSARGPWVDALADHTRTSVLVPAALLGVVFATLPSTDRLELPVAARFAVSVGMGVVLGSVATLLLGRDFRRDTAWGVLFGTTMLGIGAVTRVGQSAITTLFCMGLTLAATSRHRSVLKPIVSATERPVTLPVAVLAGASLDFEIGSFLPALIAVCILARLGLDLMRGLVLLALTRATRGAGPYVGLGLTSIGSFGLASGVTLAMKLEAPVGGSILAVTVALLVAGELVGPLCLRQALTRAGEVDSNLPARPEAQGAS